MSSALDSMFKAYDIRGKVGPELNVDSVTKIGRAFADWLPAEGTIAVGHDMRPDSAELADAMIAGLRKQGRDVLDIGQVSSDMIYFVVGDRGLAGGAMITASHNPGEYNGIKLCREKAGGISLDTGLSAVRDAVASDTFDAHDIPGSLSNEDIMEGWIDHVLSFINVSKLDGFNIAADAANGMAGAVLPHLAKKLNMTIAPMYWELDGTFPNHEANPLKTETLVDLQAKIKQDGLDFGVAFDGDGDRVGLVDDEGEIVPPSVIVAMLAKKFLEDKPGATVLYNLICSSVVKETIEANGGVAIKTKVGHSHIKADMLTHDAVFGGEHSAHYYFEDNYNADSGIIAAVIVMEMIGKSGKKLSELRKEYEKYVAITETNFSVDDKQATIGKVRESFSGEGEEDELDGLTVAFSDGWINVRPSNTEPLLRLNAEAHTQDRLDQLVSKVREVIES